ncbi:tyrosine-protein phosphatase [Streptomyces sp. NPDC056831]|uniref:tyrosine-protein phosphatase n=1 Tax=Streptomyces sp. NPDC056831 TaxID=3345954 RepID=UPI00369F694E
MLTATGQVNHRLLLPAHEPDRPWPIYRSAAQLASAPAQLAASTGTYLDLRTEREIQRDGAPHGLLGRGWQWVRMPIDDTGTYGPDEVLERTLQAARTAWRSTADAQVVVACSLGKDRTGRVAAVLLTWAGHSDDGVLADYLRSNAELRRAASKLPERWRRPGAVTLARCSDLDDVFAALRDDPRWAVPPSRRWKSRKEREIK